jgi:6-phosphogluconate dehydrogenase
MQSPLTKAPVDHKGKPALSLRIGYVGLGKMGFNMAERLLEKGYGVVAFDVNEKAIQEIAKQGAEPAASLKALAETLTGPRLLWLMVPQEIVDAVLDGITPHLEKGDTVIDGGNSFYKDSIRRANSLAAKGIDFLDVGVSGGPAGARKGACIMAGGNKEVFDRYQGLFHDLSVEKGCAYMGGSGSGHFVKMVHNGIEYGMMQALAEGFAVMKVSPFNLDLAAIAELYNHGSVIVSRLVEWLKDAFEEHGQDLGAISGSVVQSGEGAWTVETGHEYGVATPIIEGAVNFRAASATDPSYTGQIVSALRNEFGKHDVFKKDR